MPRYETLARGAQLTLFVFYRFSLSPISLPVQILPISNTSPVANHIAFFPTTILQRHGPFFSPLTFPFF